MWPSPFAAHGGTPRASESTQAGPRSTSSQPGVVRGREHGGADLRLGRVQRLESGQRRADTAPPLGIGELLGRDREQHTPCAGSAAVGGDVMEAPRRDAHAVAHRLARRIDGRQPVVRQQDRRHRRIAEQHGAGLVVEHAAAQPSFDHRAGATEHVAVREHCVDGGHRPVRARHPVELGVVPDAVGAARRAQILAAVEPGVVDGVDQVVAEVEADDDEARLQVQPLAHELAVLHRAVGTVRHLARVKAELGAESRRERVVGFDEETPGLRIADAQHVGPRRCRGVAEAACVGAARALHEHVAEAWVRAQHFGRHVGRAERAPGELGEQQQHDERHTNEADAAPDAARAVAPQHDREQRQRQRHRRDEARELVAEQAARGPRVQREQHAGQRAGGGAEIDRARAWHAGVLPECDAAREPAVRRERHDVGAPASRATRRQARAFAATSVSPSRVGVLEHSRALLCRGPQDRPWIICCRPASRPSEGPPARWHRCSSRW
jgi:hypothetical protein